MQRRVSRLDLNEKKARQVIDDYYFIGAKSNKNKKVTVFYDSLMRYPGYLTDNLVKVL